MAVWPSGKAVDCKSSIPSSNLGAALKKVKAITLFLMLNIYIINWSVNVKLKNNTLGNVVKLVDTTDLKSVA